MSGGSRASAEPRGDATAGPLAGIDLEAAAATQGSWLELSVAADHEAVEAVAEILARAAPGGTSVEPAFELVEAGLAARVDFGRPGTKKEMISVSLRAFARARAGPVRLIEPPPARKPQASAWGGSADLAG